MNDSEYYAIRSHKFPEGQHKKKNMKKRNSDSMGEFRVSDPLGAIVGIALWLGIVRHICL